MHGDDQLVVMPSQLGQGEEDLQVVAVSLDSVESTEDLLSQRLVFAQKLTCLLHEIAITPGVVDGDDLQSRKLWQRRLWKSLIAPDDTNPGTIGVPIA
jgi:hypothetical protein